MLISCLSCADESRTCTIWYQQDAELIRHMQFERIATRLQTREFIVHSNKGMLLAQTTRVQTSGIRVEYLLCICLFQQLARALHEARACYRKHNYAVYNIQCCSACVSFLNTHLAKQQKKRERVHSVIHCCASKDPPNSKL